MVRRVSADAGEGGALGAARVGRGERTLGARGRVEVIVFGKHCMSRWACLGVARTKVIWLCGLDPVRFCPGFYNLWGSNKTEI